MSLRGLDAEFLFALRTLGEKRNERELDVIYSRLYNLEALSDFREQQLRELCNIIRYESYEANEILYRKDDPCRCWYILMSGSVFIQGSMFLPYNCFGKKIPGTKRRGCQCLVLEPSEMIAIDYPDMSLYTGSITTRPHALRHSTTNSSSQSTLDSVLEADTSSSEGSPRHQSRSSSLQKSNTGQGFIMADYESQSSLSKDMDEEDYVEQYLDEDDSISLHSTSSIVIKDLVIDVLKKDIGDRNDEDLEILLEFTKSLRAFSNMTEPIRRALCKVMVFAWVESANTAVLKDNEQLDSWSVIINGQVLVKNDDKEKTLGMGDSFGVEPTLQVQSHKGTMTTICDDCQFLCIAQDEYFDVLHQGQENIQNIYNETEELVMVKERREFNNGTKKGNIVIRGKADSLMRHLLEENAIDPTYAEDFLLTYRSFSNEPLKLCSKLLEWFDQMLFRDKVSRIILLWVNNHFNDFERDWRMMALLESFEEKLHGWNMHGEVKLFNIACSAKAKPRVVSISRSSCDVELGFEILGGSEYQFPIYISTVTEGSVAEKKGVKRGDQLLEVNRQNFEKISFEKAQALIKKNTDLSFTLKTNLFAFKEMVAELKNPEQGKKKRNTEKHSRSFRVPRMASTLSVSSDNESYEGKLKKAFPVPRQHNRLRRLSLVSKIASVPAYLSNLKSGGVSQVTVDDSFLTVPTRHLLPGSSATIDTSSRALRQSSNMSHSNPDLLEPLALDFMSPTEVPEDVIKVYRADQSFRFIFVSRDTTAGDAVHAACKEFGITDDVSNYALYRVSVQGEKFVKQSKLPDPLSKLPDIPLGARYYLKQPLNSEQLLPDENIPDLLKEANFSFLDLNCFEVALYLTREDYHLFQLTESTNFIDDLFHLESQLQEFKQFEDLVNRELFWVVTTMCKEQNVFQRSKIIKHFIKIAQHCKILKNFNSAFALISGLGYRAVSRMKQTWEKVPAKNIRQFEELQALMDPSRNMSKYRTLLNEYIHQPPVIPYIPVVKKDLTFLHLGNDTKVDGLINFEKMRMIAKEVRNICKLCAPDKSQIIPSATAAQQKDDKGAIYQTLARRGRRASLNNARRMYEDQMNVRRVRQYMKLMSVISDEDQLMELSKIAEAPAETKRRNTSGILSTDSPSRTSKTLPNQSRSSHATSTGSLTTRNNSEPHLADVPIINVEGSKKKFPSSTLPKYGVGSHSPQMLSRKLLSLSEESKDDQKSKGKKIKETKRSFSVSANEYSPSSSPFGTPKHRNATKQPLLESNHTVGMENVNRNNNRRSLPADVGFSAVPETLPGSNVATSKKFLATNSSNNSSPPSSSRSSIASASSLGTVSSSAPSTSSVGGSSSPRSSSPVRWGSNGSVSSGTTSSPRLLHSHLKTGGSPARSISGSFDAAISTNTKHGYHERPVIKQARNGRSSSFGGGSMMMMTLNDRRLTQIAAVSSSSPTLNINGTQSTLILPNHPRIPRTPSIDSGVVSGGSLSADSARFHHADESEIFARSHPHHIHSSVSHIQPPHQMRQTEGYAGIDRISSSRGLSEHPPVNRSLSHSTPQERNAANDKVEQTFLSGFRGQGDPPQLEANDSYFTNFPPPATNVQVDRGKFGEDVAHYPANIPAGVGKLHTRQMVTRNLTSKSSVKGIHEFVCERHASLHGRRYRVSVNTIHNNPVMQPNYLKDARTTTAEAMLEEQLVLELQNQKLSCQRHSRRSTPVYEHQPNFVDLRRLSLSKSDPSLNNMSDPSAYSERGNSEGAAFSSSPPPSRVPRQISLDQGSRLSPMREKAFVNSSTRSSVSSSIQLRTELASESSMDQTSPLAPVASHHSASNPLVVNRPKNLPLPKRTASRSESWEHVQSNTQITSPMNERQRCPQQSNRIFAATSRPQQLMANHASEIPTQHLHHDVVDGSPYLPRDPSHQYIDVYSKIPPQNRRSSAGNIPASHVLVQQAHYQKIQHSQEQWHQSQVRRKTSQEWSEIDLDGEKKQQAMKAWEGGASPLASTPLPGNLTASNQGYPLPPCNLQPNLLHDTSRSVTMEPIKNAKKPPAPPQRKSSISRSHQLQSSSSSSRSSPPPIVGGCTENTEIHSNNFDGSFRGGNTSLDATQQRNASFSAASVPEQSNNYERRSLPTYTEAVHQINAKQSSMFPSPLPNSYRSFPIDAHKNQEQISQV